MLVLQRKQGESIQIGRDVTVQLIRTKGKTARLGVLAPADVPVYRHEIVQRDATACDSATPAELRAIVAHLQLVRGTEPPEICAAVESARIAMLEAIDRHIDRPRRCSA